MAPAPAPPHVSEVANWIIYMNVGAVLFLILSGFIIVPLIKKWLNTLVTAEFCQLSQVKCQKNMALALAETLQKLEACSKEEHGMIYKEIKTNREKSISNFTALHDEISSGITRLTNLFVDHIQKNGQAKPHA